ncbi:MAG TPA: histidine kinase [Promicromonospora sp.]|nr:histidine kinase [Promicromonospora sp.]
MTDLTPLPGRWLSGAVDRWHRLDVTVRDLPLALLHLGLGLVPVLREYGTQLGGLPARPLDGWALLAMALLTLPLAVRRRWPLVCVLVVSGGFALAQLLAYPSFASNAFPVVLLSTGAHLARRRALVAGGLAAAYVVLAMTLDRLGGDERLDEYVTFFVAVAVFWGAGAWLRSTRAADAEHRLRLAEEARAVERARIARDLHDVVTHHVTAMVVQAESARYLTGAPDRLEQTLDAVTGTGRRAITDLRHLLDVLDPGHDGPTTGGHPSRTLSTGELDALVEQTRQAGQPVELVREGTQTRDSGSAELVAYRVVQEALTNALKHAPGAATTVRVRHDEREISVEVTTASGGGPRSRVGQQGGGRGLAGLRERVTAVGGALAAGPTDAGGFAVRARIPSGAPAPSTTAAHA